MFIEIFNKEKEDKVSHVCSHFILPFFQAFHYQTYLLYLVAFADMGKSAIVKNQGIIVTIY
jgi:hypothetical protein